MGSKTSKFQLKIPTTAVVPATVSPTEVLVEHTKSVRYNNYDKYLSLNERAERDRLLTPG